MLDGAKFVCLDENGDPYKTIEVKGRVFSIGYLMDCDYIIGDNDEVEKIHCRIECDAFGHVTIYNKSAKNPISVNGETVSVKRTLFNNSKIRILDKEYMWHLKKTVCNVDVVSENPEEMSTPVKQVGIPEQAPTSCPALRHHRDLPKRFTVHNLRSYRVDSDANVTIDNDESSNQHETTTDNPVSQTSLLELDTTPAKVDLVDSTANKKTSSTEKRIKAFRNSCGWSGMITTSYSPRETGVRTEKTFTAIIPPTTPRSARCRTPKGLLERLHLQGERSDCSNVELLSFSTPTKKPEGQNGQGIVVQHAKSAMKIVDLTTPSKLRAQSPLARPISSKKPTSAKSFVSFSEKNAATVAKGFVTPKTSMDDTPTSSASVISVDSTDASDISEVTDANIVSSTTPLRAQLPVASGLRKQALLASAKKQGTNNPMTPKTPSLSIPVRSATKTGTPAVSNTSTQIKHSATTKDTKSRETFAIAKKNPVIRKLDVSTGKRTVDPVSNSKETPSSTSIGGTKDNNNRNETTQLPTEQLKDKSPETVGANEIGSLATSTPYKPQISKQQSEKTGAELFSILHSSNDEEISLKTDSNNVSKEAEDSSSLKPTLDEGTAKKSVSENDDLMKEIEEILSTSDELRKQLQTTETVEENEVINEDFFNAESTSTTSALPKETESQQEANTTPSKNSLSASILLKAINSVDKNKPKTLKEDEEKENKFDECGSLSTAEPSVDEANVANGVPLTPKRITKRRPSILLENDEVPVAEKSQRIIDTHNTENMGAIIEEETEIVPLLPEQHEVPLTGSKNITDTPIKCTQSKFAATTIPETPMGPCNDDTESALIDEQLDDATMSPLHCSDESFAEAVLSEELDEDLFNGSEKKEKKIPIELVERSSEDITAPTTNAEHVTFDENFGEIEHASDTIKETDLPENKCVKTTLATVNVVDEKSDTLAVEHMVHSEATTCTKASNNISVQELDKKHKNEPKIVSEDVIEIVDSSFETSIKESAIVCLAADDAKEAQDTTIDILKVKEEKGVEVPVMEDEAKSQHTRDISSPQLFELESDDEDVNGEDVNGQEPLLASPEDEKMSQAHNLNETFEVKQNQSTTEAVENGKELLDGSQHDCLTKEIEETSVKDFDALPVGEKNELDSTGSINKSVLKEAATEKLLSDQSTELQQAIVLETTHEVLLVDEPLELNELDEKLESCDLSTKTEKESIIAETGKDSIIEECTEQQLIVAKAAISLAPSIKEHEINVENAKNEEIPNEIIVSNEVSKENDLLENLTTLEKSKVIPQSEKKIKELNAGNSEHSVASIEQLNDQPQQSQAETIELEERDEDEQPTTSEKAVLNDMEKKRSTVLSEVFEKEISEEGNETVELIIEQHTPTDAEADLQDDELTELSGMEERLALDDSIEESNERTGTLSEAESLELIAMEATLALNETTELDAENVGNVKTNTSVKELNQPHLEELCEVDNNLTIDDVTDKTKEEADVSEKYIDKSNQLEDKVNDKNEIRSEGKASASEDILKSSSFLIEALPENVLNVQQSVTVESCDTIQKQSEITEANKEEAKEIITENEKDKLEVVELNQTQDLEPDEEILLLNETVDLLDNEEDQSLNVVSKENEDSHSQHETDHGAELDESMTIAETALLTSTIDLSLEDSEQSLKNSTNVQNMKEVTTDDEIETNKSKMKSKMGDQEKGEVLNEVVERQPSSESVLEEEEPEATENNSEETIPTEDLAKQLGESETDFEKQQSATLEENVVPTTNTDSTVAAKLEVFETPRSDLDQECHKQNSPKVLIVKEDTTDDEIEANKSNIADQEKEEVLNKVVERQPSSEGVLEEEEAEAKEINFEKTLPTDDLAKQQGEPETPQDKPAALATDVENQQSATLEENVVPTTNTDSTVADKDEEFETLSSELDQECNNQNSPKVQIVKEDTTDDEIEANKSNIEEEEEVQPSSESVLEEVEHSKLEEPETNDINLEKTIPTDDLETPQAKPATLVETDVEKQQSATLEANVVPTTNTDSTVAAKHEVSETPSSELDQECKEHVDLPQVTVENSVNKPETLKKDHEISAESKEALISPIVDAHMENLTEETTDDLSAETAVAEKVEELCSESQANTTVELDGKLAAENLSTTLANELIVTNKDEVRESLEGVIGNLPENCEDLSLNDNEAELPDQEKPIEKEDSIEHTETDEVENPTTSECDKGFSEDDSEVHDVTADEVVVQKQQDKPDEVVSGKTIDQVQHPTIKSDKSVENEQQLPREVIEEKAETEMKEDNDSEESIDVPSLKEIHTEKELITVPSEELKENDQDQIEKRADAAADKEQDTVEDMQQAEASAEEKDEITDTKQQTEEIMSLQRTERSSLINNDAVESTEVAPPTRPTDKPKELVQMEASEVSEKDEAAEKSHTEEKTTQKQDSAEQMIDVAENTHQRDEKVSGKPTSVPTHAVEASPVVHTSAPADISAENASVKASEKSEEEVDAAEKKLHEVDEVSHAQVSSEEKLDNAESEHQADKHISQEASEAPSSTEPKTLGEPQVELPSSEPCENVAKAAQETTEEQLDLKIALSPVEPVDKCTETKPKSIKTETTEKRPRRGRLVRNAKTKIDDPTEADASNEASVVEKSLNIVEKPLEKPETEANDGHVPVEIEVGAVEVKAIGKKSTQLETKETRPRRGRQGRTASTVIEKEEEQNIVKSEVAKADEKQLSEEHTDVPLSDASEPQTKPKSTKERKPRRGKAAQLKADLVLEEIKQEGNEATEEAQSDQQNEQDKEDKIPISVEEPISESEDKAKAPVENLEESVHSVDKKTVKVETILDVSTQRSLRRRAQVPSYEILSDSEEEGHHTSSRKRRAPRNTQKQARTSSFVDLTKESAETTSTANTSKAAQRTTRKKPASALQAEHEEQAEELTVPSPKKRAKRKAEPKGHSTLLYDMLLDEEETTHEKEQVTEVEESNETMAVEAQKPQKGKKAATTTHGRRGVSKAEKLLDDETTKHADTAENVTLPTTETPEIEPARPASRRGVKKTAKATTEEADHDDIEEKKAAKPQKRTAAARKGRNAKEKEELSNETESVKDDEINVTNTSTSIKSRGKKHTEEAVEVSDTEVQLKKTPKRRGRAAKAEIAVEEDVEELPTKRKRRQSAQSEQHEEVPTSPSLSTTSTSAARKPRGRRGRLVSSESTTADVAQETESVPETVAKEDTAKKARVARGRGKQTEIVEPVTPVTEKRRKYTKATTNKDDEEKEEDVQAVEMEELPLSESTPATKSTRGRRAKQNESTEVVTTTVPSRRKQTKAQSTSQPEIVESIAVEEVEHEVKTNLDETAAKKTRGRRQQPEAVETSKTTRSQRRKHVHFDEEPSEAGDETHAETTEKVVVENTASEVATEPKRRRRR